MEKRNTWSNSASLDDIKALFNNENAALSKHIETLIDKCKNELIDMIKVEVLKINNQLETLSNRVANFENEL